MEIDYNTIIGLSIVEVETGRVWPEEWVGYRDDITIEEAEEEIVRVIGQFNETLRGGELERQAVCFSLGVYDETTYIGEG